MAIRVVIDVNIYVSAHMSEAGTAAQVIDAVSEGRLQVVASPELIDEVDEVLHRQRLRRQIPQDRADQTVIDLRLSAEMHYPDEAPIPITRDSKDDYLVQLAQLAEVDYLVTGDRDLLESGVDNVTIISTGEFVRSVLTDK